MIGLAEVQRRLGDHALVHGVDQLPRGHVRIETRLLYPDGTSVEVFVPNDLDAPLFRPSRVTDLGQTTAWLLNVSVRPWLSAKRRAFLEDAIRLYGVSQNGGELEHPLPDLDALPEAMLRLGQACVRVADLIYTRRAALQTAFVEDVEEVIADAERRYVRDVELEGRFKKPVRVDFVVYGDRTKSAVLALASGNSSQAHVLANEIFRRWYDLDIPERTEQRVTVFDDSRDVYRDDDLERLRHKSLLVPLSDRRTLSDLLAV